MNNTLSKVFIFAAGAAIGSAVTWKLLKEKYEQIAQEEIESVKEVFANREPLKFEEPEEDEEIDEDVEEEVKPVGKNEKPDLKAYATMLAEQGYINYSGIGKEEKKEEVDNVDRPYVIPPEEFGEMDGYDTVSLVYYTDGVLTDDNYNLIEDADECVGKDFDTHFGEYEDDSVFVRNDARKCDYEILADYRSYESIRPRPKED